MNVTPAESVRLLKSQSTVCVVGIGRIGLPTALSFANADLTTIGVDINTQLVNMVNQGNYPLKDEPGFDVIFEKVTKNKKLSATTDIHSAVNTCSLIILSLPTPMDKDNVPDYSALKSVADSLGASILSGSLVVVESTVEPGFVENTFIPIIENGPRKLKAGKDFAVAACPETANPGEILKDFKKLPRVIGAINENTTEIISEIYRYVFGVEIVKMPNCRTANAVKLTTNVFRDINIAFVNELALLFEKLDIDIYKVLEAASKKYNFQTHYPGAGVGGPCLPVNSYQFLNSARSSNKPLKMVDAARSINEHMPFHVIELLDDALQNNSKTIRDSTVTILGITYKPNVKDIQLSPAELIIKQLDDKGAHVKIYDPYFKSVEVFSHKTENDLVAALQNSNAVIIVTAHSEFDDMDPTLFVSKMNTPIVIDSRGIIDPKAAKKAGITFRGVGRGGV
jgi:nucleotide sugar dehydrogenase